MKDVTIPQELIQEKILIAIPKAIEEALSRSYDNPLKDAIQKVIKDNIGWEELVRKAFTEIIKGDQFKNELINAMLVKYFKNDK